MEDSFKAGLWCCPDVLGLQLPSVPGHWPFNESWVSNSSWPSPYHTLKLAADWKALDMTKSLSSQLRTEFRD